MSIRQKNDGTRPKAPGGRPRQWDENMQARFKAGTIGRIEDVLREGETRVGFVNDAVLRELARREKAKNRKQ